jgi:aryl-alcohol dehydrogenase-like predicted oxidoreductase
MVHTDLLAAQSGSFTIGGDLPVHRLGFGTMQLTGKGVWGEPADRQEALAVLRRAVELGITLFDTADSYGPEVAERLMAEALHPYPDDLVIATKAGFQRPGPGRWVEDGRPEHLKEACEGSLQRLRLDRIDLLQLHRIDPKVPAEDQIGALLDLRSEGKIRHIGLSEVTVEQIETVRRMTPVATVQNRYNLTDRKSEDVLDYCTRESIGFIPWFPLAAGKLTKPGGPLDRVAQRLDAQPAQVALAWLLHKSPVMLPIPGTSKIEHLEANTAAAALQLDDSTMRELESEPPR